MWLVLGFDFELWGFQCPPDRPRGMVGGGGYLTTEARSLGGEAK
jgi:hypothetical protein